MSSPFATHEVLNQPPPLVGVSLFTSDAALRDSALREGGEWGQERLMAFGEWLGEPETRRLGEQANRHGPELRTHDRFGHRIDEVEFHPAWHRLMARAVAERVHALPWKEPRRGAHVVRAAAAFMLNQIEAGVCCPMAMTFAAMPVLSDTPDITAAWIPKILSADYDPSRRPIDSKRGALIGMAMTEKQGGSDVRANTTRANAIGNGAHELVGHKWFCSAPMSDAFLTLAQTERGLSCFFVPRWQPDGSRNAFHIQRLKDKLGNRSNASAEIEYGGALAYLLGEDGQGVRTIIKMVHHTRLDAAVSAAGLMRQAVAQALHHSAYRTAFQKRLIDQALMQNVLADLAIEVEAATILIMRVAGAFDRASSDSEEQDFGRLATPITKYWLGKQAPRVIVEALECLGGNGYVEESILPRLYREAPVNSVWEGAGNVICLDVLRAIDRSPEVLQAVLREIEKARGGNRWLDVRLNQLVKFLPDWRQQEGQARVLVEQLALALTGALLVQHAPANAADAYCASRLANDSGRQFGTLPSGLDLTAIVARAQPMPT